MGTLAPLASSPINRRQLLQFGGVAALGALTAAALAGCAPGGGGSGDLKLMYWGSAYEQKALSTMITKYNAKTKGKHFAPMYVPSNNYDTKMTTLIASHTAPDMAYLNPTQLYDFAQKGLILNLYPYLDKYPQLKERLPSSYFWYGKDKLAGNQLAMGMQILYYNTEAFKDAGVDPLPVTAGTALTWDAFVELADKLTIDQKGRHPSESGFDADNVKQYGTIAPTGGGGLNSLLMSNHTDVLSEDGKTFTLDSADGIDVLQKIQDLIYKHRVAPTPAQLGKNAPTSSVQLQTRRVAMTIDGNWALLDMLESSVPFGVGVLPKFKESITATGGSAGAIFKQTKFPEETIEMYLHYNDPKNVNLFTNGLWAPLEKKYYENDADIKTWVTNKFPTGFKTVAIDTTLNNGKTNWDQTAKNTSKIFDVLNPGLEQISLGKVTASKAVHGLTDKITPLLQGRWPSQPLS